MLTNIRIEGLRGIRDGQVQDLPSGVTVFVGANGSGKSTILEALLLSASPDPGDAVGRVVRNRRTLGGERWLFHRADMQPIKLALSHTKGFRECTLMLNQDSGKGRSITSVVDAGVATWEAVVSFDGASKYVVQTPQGNHRLPSLGQVRWLAPYGQWQEPLPDVYSDAVNQGRRKAARDIIREIVPGLEDVELLTESGIPVIHLVFADHSVPVESCGDGVMSLVRLAFELAARPNGIVLLEEPEVHEHPGALRQTSLAILAAARRDIQVVLSTHSLDLIDALIASANEADLANLCVYRCALDQGQLKTTRIPGAEVARLRTEIGEDLR